MSSRLFGIARCIIVDEGVHYSTVAFLHMYKPRLEVGQFSFRKLLAGCAETLKHWALVTAATGLSWKHLTGCVLASSVCA